MKTLRKYAAVAVVVVAIDGGGLLAYQNALPHTAIGMSTTPDETGLVQQQINDTPDGGTIDFKGRRYQVDGTVRVNGRKGLTIANATFAAGNTYDITRTDFTREERTRSQVSVSGGSEDITIRNVHVEGSNRDWISSYQVPDNGLEGQAGFHIGGAKRVEFDRCSAEWTHGDAFSIQGGGNNETGHIPAEDIWIHDCTTRHIGRIVFLHNNVRRAVFERNHSTYSHRPVWHSEPNFSDSIVEDVHILDNVNGIGTEMTGSWKGGKPTTTPIRRIVVARNRGEGVSLAGVFGLFGASPRREHFYWVDNTSDTIHPAPHVVSLYQATSVMVRGNVQPLRKGGAFLTSQRSCGVNADVDGYYEPCDLTPEPAAPTVVPAIPPEWPYPRDEVPPPTRRATACQRPGRLPRPPC
jgi:hypothetical protein